MARRSDVLRILVGTSRGTGFLIRHDRVLTALHVIGSVVEGKLHLHGETIHLTAAVPGDTDEVPARFPVCVCDRDAVIDFDPEFDWATIAVDAEAFKNAAVSVLDLVAPTDQRASWSSYGFPDGAAELGKATAGSLASTGALVRIGSIPRSALQLFSLEAGAASGGAVHGYSGAPVLVEDHVIGFLCAASTDADGKSAEGTLYAIPLAALAKRLGLELVERETRAATTGLPPPLDDPRRMQDLSIAQWIVIGLGAACLVSGTASALASNMPIKGVLGLLGIGVVVIALALIFDRIPRDETGSTLKWITTVITVLILGLAYASVTGLYEAATTHPVAREETRKASGSGRRAHVDAGAPALLEGALGESIASADDLVEAPKALRSIAHEETRKSSGSGVDARMQASLADSLGSSTVNAEDFDVVVNGNLIGAANRGERTVGLYADKSLHSGSLAIAKTNHDGKFELRMDGTTPGLRIADVWVVCLPSGDIACTPHQLVADRLRPQRNNLTIADIELTCASVVGASPAEMAAALAALAETYEVLVWAGEEKLDAADAVLKKAAARADVRLNADDRERFKVALAAALKPLRVPSHRGLPLLPSLKRDDFASELIAAASSWRWLTQPEGNDQRPVPYAERDGRFEGSIAIRVGSTFREALVSLSEGPLSVDPETQSQLGLTWSAPAWSRLCIDASPIVPWVDWKMRVAVVPGGASFVWDLSTARRAGMKKDTLGIVARSCADVYRDQGPYVPVRGGGAVPKEVEYRLVFRFPRQLTDVSAIVFQGEGRSRRTIALPEGAVTYDPEAPAPVVTIDVPSWSLEPGFVHLEMRGRGPGGFGPDGLSFFHSQRAAR